TLSKPPFDARAQGDVRRQEGVLGSLALSGRVSDRVSPPVPDTPPPGTGTARRRPRRRGGRAGAGSQRRAARFVEGAPGGATPTARPLSTAQQRLLPGGKDPRGRRPRACQAAWFDVEFAGPRLRAAARPVDAPRHVPVHRDAHRAPGEPSVGRAAAVVGPAGGYGGDEILGWCGC